MLMQPSPIAETSRSAPRMRFSMTNLSFLEFVGVLTPSFDHQHGACGMYGSRACPLPGSIHDARAPYAEGGSPYQYPLSQDPPSTESRYRRSEARIEAPKRKNDKV